MRKKVSYLTVCIFMFSLVLMSCKSEKKDDSNEAATEQSSSAEETEKGDAAVEDYDNNQTSENLITKNVGEYPRDIELFKDNVLSKRFRDLVGNEFDAIYKNFETETPIITDEDIYKFSGCRQHNCPAFLTTFLYDAENDNFNIIVEKEGDKEVYKEKDEIKISEELKMM